MADMWTDADPPLAYRFTVQIKGQDGQPTQLQDFSPLAEYKGTLPGGLDDQGGVVIVGVEVMDSLGAVSKRMTLEVKSTWPVIESEAGTVQISLTPHLYAARTRPFCFPHHQCLTVYTTTCT